MNYSVFLDFLVLIFPSSFWGLVVNILFISYNFNLLLVSQYFVGFFPFFFVCVQHFFLWFFFFDFFLSLELNSKFSVFPSSAGVAHLFLFFGFWFSFVEFRFYRFSYVLSLPPKRTVTCNGFPSFLASSNRLKYR